MLQLMSGPAQTKQSSVLPFANELFTANDTSMFHWIVPKWWCCNRIFVDVDHHAFLFLGAVAASLALMWCSCMCVCDGCVSLSWKMKMKRRRRWAARPSGRRSHSSRTTSISWPRFSQSISLLIYGSSKAGLRSHTHSHSVNCLKSSKKWVFESPGSCRYV